MKKASAPTGNLLLRAAVSREIALGNGKKLRAATARTCPPRLMDKLSSISPRWRNGRDFDRMGRTILAGGYEITEASRTRRSRRGGSDGGADVSADDQTLWDLREICRDGDRNSPLLSGIIDRVADNVAGPEYTFRPDTKDKIFNKDAVDLLAANSAACEYRGMFNMQETLETSFRSLLPDGDFLTIFLKDNRLQMIEAHDLVTPASRLGRGGRRVVGGVELDGRGIPTAYYIRDPAKAGPFGYSNWVSSWKDVQRIDASNARLVANRKRFTQNRGVPVLAASLKLHDRLDAYLDSESLAAELASHLTWWIKRSATTSNPFLPGTDAQTDKNESSDSESTFNKIIRSEPGAVFDLGLEGEMGINDSKRPGTQFEPYIVTMLRMIGAGVGVPLELVLLDFSKTNYSSARASLLQAYRTFQRWQRIVRDRMIVPIYNRWMTNWLASGDLRPLGGGESYKLKCFPPRWAWLDPLKMVLAKTKQIEAGAGLLEDWLAEDDQVLEVFADARSRELQLYAKLGIPTTTAPENLARVADGDGDKNEGAAE